MPYSSEYTDPLVRKTLVQAAVVSGYVAARLHSQETYQPSISGTAQTLLLTWENVGGTAFSVLLRETPDASISGTRYNVTSPVMLVPSGQYTESAVCKQPFLEVYCTGTTTGRLRLQIDAQRRWDQMGFNKDDPFFAPQLWQAKEVPGPS